MKSSTHLIFLLLLLGMFSCTKPEKAKLTKGPNILFCIADDASFAHFGAYGSTWVNTPAFDRVAAEGVLFTRAYTPNAKCAPSRSCILTGRNPWQLEEAMNHWPFFPAKFKTYVEALDDNGYFVGYSGKGWAPGIARDAQGNKRELAGRPFNEIKTEPPAKAISTKDYAQNFKAFMEVKPKDEPFCFWYGGHEPHRSYEYGAGVKYGNKQLSDVTDIPPFWPDNDSIRNDMLDYAFEIEYFDQHLAQILQILEEAGELDNTLVVVTADNGMPFPRIKGQKYEYANHLPLAIMWKDGIKHSTRVVDDFINFTDFAPTFLEIAGLTEAESGMQAISGKSLTDILFTEKAGTVNEARDHILLAKERHDIGRPNDWGYPIRGIVKGNYLYLHNFEIDRWPAGNPETGYLNCDGSPTKTALLQRRTHPDTYNYWNWSFGKRPAEELYQIDNDPFCMHNLAENEQLFTLKEALKTQLFNELEAQGDYRMLGKAYLYDEIVYADSSGQNFYEKYMRGEEVNFGWVNKTDFEKIEDSTILLQISRE